MHQSMVVATSPAMWGLGEDFKRGFSKTPHLEQVQLSNKIMVQQQGLNLLVEGSQMPIPGHNFTSNPVRTTTYSPGGGTIIDRCIMNTISSVLYESFVL